MKSMTKGGSTLFFLIGIAAVTIICVIYFNNCPPRSFAKRPDIQLRIPDNADNDGELAERDPQMADARMSGPEPSLSADDWSQPDDHPSMVFLRKVSQMKTPLIPSLQELQNLSDKHLNYIYHSYLDNTNVICNRQLRLGRAADGGYETCDDYQYRPMKPCIAYSFGIRNDFTFDDDVGKLYGCDVFSFDPMMKKETHRRSARVMFYAMAIGGPQHKTSVSMINVKKQTNWTVKTLTEIKAMLQHQGKIIDILKMDIEASEWPTLLSLLGTGELQKVRQLLIEFHNYEKNMTILQKVDILRRIEGLGFRKFRTHNFFYRYSWKEEMLYPVDRGCCYEMGFVNTRLARDLPAA